MTGRDVLADAMTEKQLQDTVADLCRRLGLRVYHPYESRRSEPGWPDLAIVGTKLMLRELKTARGRLSVAQRHWLADLQAARVDADVWRPQHLRDGTITLQLRAITHRPPREVAM